MRYGRRKFQGLYGEEEGPVRRAPRRMAIDARPPRYSDPRIQALFDKQSTRPARRAPRRMAIDAGPPRYSDPRSQAFYDKHGAALARARISSSTAFIEEANDEFDDAMNGFFDFLKRGFTKFAPKVFQAGKKVLQSALGGQQAAPQQPADEMEAEGEANDEFDDALNGFFDFLKRGFSKFGPKVFQAGTKVLQSVLGGQQGGKPAAQSDPQLQQQVDEMVAEANDLLDEDLNGFFDFLKRGFSKFAPKVFQAGTKVLQSVLGGQKALQQGTPQEQQEAEEVIAEANEEFDEAMNGIFSLIFKGLKMIPKVVKGVGSLFGGKKKSQPPRPVRPVRPVKPVKPVKQAQGKKSDDIDDDLNEILDLIDEEEYSSPMRRMRSRPRPRPRPRRAPRRFARRSQRVMQDFFEEE